MFLGTLGASLLRNILAGKEINKAGEGVRAGYGNKRQDYENKTIMLPRPLINFEIQKYYQNEPKFNGLYSTDTLPDAIKDEAYVINLGEYSDIGTHWIAL